jgi:tetratricopeptide (TPR) repeat protein
MVLGHINLGEFEEAVSLGEEVLRTHSGEATIWSVYADALKAAGRLAEGIEALDEVKALDPEYPNIAMRQGRWLLDDGQIDAAVPYLQEAAARGEQSVDQVAYQIFANAVNEGIQKSQWSYAIQTLRLAKDFDVSDLTEQEFNFFLGYAIYSKATAESAPNTLETARATLPQFQEVLRLMQSCGDYAQRNNRESNRQELLNAANTYIGIQEAIIKRGG